jgi:CRISPR-associated endonuclease/helicase Cas3
MGDDRIRRLLSAPMLVCTVDHLMPSTEAQRAGRQIAPMLRLMSSDLVLDELDDFDIADLPALTRLVHWAGLLGSRVLLSSATLPPALVEGMFQAYRAGRLHYLRNRGPHGGQASVVSDIACLWVDEFNVHAAACANAPKFVEAHAQFVERRVKALARVIEKDGPRRCGELLPLKMERQSEQEVRRRFAAEVLSAVMRAHDAHHEICPHSSKQISFGLVRMANIEPLFDVALELFRLGAPENYRIHLCVYHARFPLLLRSAIEHQLDTTLDRRMPQAVYEHPGIRRAIDEAPERNHLFVVLGSPVTEVGRDHDYDWAVVEPSSMRSLIQLAGRVQRHRNRVCESPNIFIFDTNLRHFAQVANPAKQPAAFVRPGFEDEHAGVDAPFRLTSHRLGDLLAHDEYRVITARPRIQARAIADRQPKRSLVDLEHARLIEQMLPKSREQASSSRFAKPASRNLDAACAWQYPQAALTWALPQQQPFRDDAGADVDLLFLPDENEERLVIHRIYEKATRDKSAIYTTAESLVERLQLDCGPRIAPWGNHDLDALLMDQVEGQGMSPRQCAERFTVVSVPKSEQGWRYHSVLGFGRKK